MQIGWRSSRQTASRWFYPLVLLVLSTCYCMTERGLFLDDRYYVQRSAADGLIDSLMLDRPIHFWRPIYRLTVPVLLTACSEHLWIAYAVVAMAHGGVALLLWRLVRKLGGGPIASAFGALLFLVWPAHFEAVLWLSAIPTVLSAGAMVAAWNMQVDAARRTRRGAAWIIPLFVGISVCSNEQAACGVAALPAIYFASISGLGSFRSLLARCILPAVLGSALIIAYMQIHKSMGLPPPTTADGAYAAAPRRMLEHVQLAIPWMLEQSFGFDYLCSALTCAADVVHEHPRRAAIFAGLVTVGLKVWADRTGKDSAAAARMPAASSGPLRPWWMLIAAVAVFSAPLAPIIAMCYWMVSRVMYAPNLAIPFLAVVAGALGERLGTWLGFVPRASVRSGIAYIAGVLLIVPAVAMVGFQHGYVERGAQDERELSQLVNLVPKPDPWSVFVPVYVDLPALKPRRISRFDHYYWSPFHAWWSATWAVRVAYRRDDLLSAYALWHDHGLGKLNEGFCTVRIFLGEPVRWEKLIPFSVDNQGRMHIITEIAYEDKVYPIPQTSLLAAQGRFPRLRFNPLTGYSTP